MGPGDAQAPGLFFWVGCVDPNMEPLIGPSDAMPTPFLANKSRVPSLMILLPKLYPADTRLLVSKGLGSTPAVTPLRYRRKGYGIPIALPQKTETSSRSSELSICGFFIALPQAAPYPPTARVR